MGWRDPYPPTRYVLISDVPRLACCECTRYFHGYACRRPRDCPAHFIYCVHDWVGSVACQADLKQAEPLRGGRVGGGLCAREDVLPPAGVWPAFRKRRRSQRQEVRRLVGKAIFLFAYYGACLRTLARAVPLPRHTPHPRCPSPSPTSVRYLLDEVDCHGYLCKSLSRGSESGLELYLYSLSCRLN